MDRSVHHVVMMVTPGVLVANARSSICPGCSGQIQPDVIDGPVARWTTWACGSCGYRLQEHVRKNTSPTDGRRPVCKTVHEGPTPSGLSKVFDLSCPVCLEPPTQATNEQSSCRCGRFRLHTMGNASFVYDGGKYLLMTGNDGYLYQHSGYPDQTMTLVRDYCRKEVVRAAVRSALLESVMMY